MERPSLHRPKAWYVGPSKDLSTGKTIMMYPEEEGDTWISLAEGGTTVGQRAVPSCESLPEGLGRGI